MHAMSQNSQEEIDAIKIITMADGRTRNQNNTRTKTTRKINRAAVKEIPYHPHINNTTAAPRKPISCIGQIPKPENKSLLSFFTPASSILRRFG